MEKNVNQNPYKLEHPQLAAALVTQSTMHLLRPGAVVVAEEAARTQAAMTTKVLMLAAMTSRKEHVELTSNREDDALRLARLNRLTTSQSVTTI
jgi:hypothetical protein